MEYLRNKRTIIGALKQFDRYGRFPDGRHRHTLFERGVLDIQYSKGHDQHYIVLHDSMLEVMPRYDTATG